MNKYSIEDQCRTLCRLAGLDDYEPYLDSWISLAHAILCTEFEIPSYKLLETISSVKDQDLYCFPYVYDGTDVSIYYNGKRLDPYPEDMLDLVMDRRTGNKGPVRWYDWAGIVNANLLNITDAVITNRSTTVTSVSNPFTDAHIDQWCVFSPFEDAAGEIQNPGDFGYKIDSSPGAGQVELEEAYRGPSSTAANPCRMRIRPKETQRFRLYGIPTVADKDIDMKIYRRPRRLYNNEDTPEWPQIGMPIACLSVMLGLEHLQRYDEAMVWEKRALNYLGSIKRRRRKTEMLTPNVPLSRISGRLTGLPNIRQGLR